MLFQWKDEDGELTLSDREGGWEGMNTENEIHVSRAGGDEKIIRYTGREITIRI